MTPSGRTKTYASLEHLNITLQPEDLKRLDAIPGNSRNERIVHLLSIYTLANQLVNAYDCADEGVCPQNDNCITEGHEQARELDGNLLTDTILAIPCEYVGMFYEILGVLHDEIQADYRETP